MPANFYGCGVNEMIKVYNHFNTCNIFILPGIRQYLPSNTSNKIDSTNNKILPTKIAECVIYDPSGTSWRIEKSNNVKDNIQLDFIKRRFLRFFGIEFNRGIFR